MNSPRPDDEQVERLQTEFRLYDRNVDVVSAWELIFTQSDTALPRHVRHFERFPVISIGQGRELTPDFTVLFEDSTGIAAEIANFGRDEASIEALCEQIGRYDELDRLPAEDGTLVEVSAVDVVLFVPLELGTAAIRRIIGERFLNDKHAYKPQAAPIIVQFALTSQGSERYVFQRRPDRGNGDFRDTGRPDKARLSTSWFGAGDVSVKPRRFREIKAARAFMNDPVASLYLATFLWAKPFAASAEGAGDSRPVEIEVVPTELAERVRALYGVVRARDIERAMTFLEGARLARRTPNGWTVYWRELHQSGDDRDLADVLARRFVRPPSRPAWRDTPAETDSQSTPVQDSLF